MKKHILASTLLAIASAPALAADKTITGEGELGYTMTSTAANTESQSLIAKFGVNYKKDVWGNQFKIENIKAETTSTTNVTTPSAERSIVSNKLTYDINGRLYALGNLRYEDDEFSSFHYQRSLTLGAGYHAINTDTTKLDLELGFGTLESKDRLTGQSQSGASTRFYENFSHKLTDTTDFTQSLLLEGNSDNLQSTLDLGLKVAISSAMALKLSHQVKKNSDVPVGTGKYDRTSSVTLVYGF